MRIVHAIDQFSYCDGCARHVLLLAKYQQEIGHDVCVITGGGDAVEFLATNRIEAHVLPEIRHVDRTPFGFVQGGINVRTFLVQFHPEIIHAHHYYVANQIRYLSPNWFRRTLLTTHQNLRFRPKLSEFVGQQIIAVSESTQEHILQRDRSVRNRLTVVHCGIDFLFVENSLEQSRRILELSKRSEGVRLIGFFGRLVEAKGIFVLAEAFIQLRKSRNFELVIAGEGEAEEELRSRLQSVGSAVHWIGTLRSVRPAMEVCDLIVVPSLSLEGLPLVALEAGLLRKAVVASRTDGIPEAISDNSCGKLIPPNDSDSLRNAISELLDNDELRLRMGQGLMRKVKTDFTVQRMADQTMEVYMRLLFRPMAKHPRDSGLNSQ